MTMAAMRIAGMKFCFIVWSGIAGFWADRNSKLTIGAFSLKAVRSSRSRLTWRNTAGLFDGATPQQQAGNYVREQILTGRFPVGMRLKSEEIARTLGFSRMPVRDALQQLHSEGLVSIRPNRGAIVTTLTGDEIRELFEIRAVLEGLAAYHCCANITAEKMVRFEA